jgi:hypothetical protein
MRSSQHPDLAAWLREYRRASREPELKDLQTIKTLESTTPSPVADLRQILAMLSDVLPVLDKLVMLLRRQVAIERIPFPRYRMISTGKTAALEHEAS